MNYATLFQTIQAYVENDFPDTAVIDTSRTATTFQDKTQIDTFIKQAEQRIYNSVQILALRKNATASCTANNKYLATPSDWLSSFSVAVVDGSGNYSYLTNKDVTFIRESYPNPTSTGLPQHYALFDETAFILGPTPDSAYTIELHYFYYPTSIVTASTSWLGDNFDSVLLYGSLLEAYSFMKGESDVHQVYQKRYDDAMLMLKQLEEGKNRQDMYRTPQIRYPVR